MENLPLERFSIREKHMAAIGRVISQWAFFELGIKELLSKLLKTDSTRTQLVLLTVRSFQSQKKLIENLAYPYLSEEKSNQLRVILKAAEEISQKRNLLAHGIVILSENDDDDENEISILKAVKSQEHGATYDVYVAKNINNTYEEIINLHREVVMFSQSITPDTLTPKSTELLKRLKAVKDEFSDD